MSSKSPEEFLDWLCWKFAKDGERFYPPNETAKGCMESLPDDRYEDGSTEEAEALGWEKGQHSRAVMTARDFFDSAERHGFDPVEAAAREHRRLMKKDDVSIEPLDWEWRKS